jgi:hypothetical protein
MYNYLKLIELKNIFLIKINKLDKHFKQYGGINFDDEIKKYKSYNDNLEIINRYIDILLTIKYIEYLIYLIKSFKGIGKNIFLTKLKDKINKLRSSNIIKLRDIIIHFIDYDRENTSNIITNTSNIITNKSNINNIYDEFNIYKQDNNVLFQIIIKNETKIKDLYKYLKINTDLILVDDEHKQVKMCIQNKFIFLLGIIKEIFEFIILLKYEHKSIFNNLVINIFTICNHSFFYENNKKITEISRQIASINKKI